MLINGHEIYIETHGSHGGPPIIFLHHGLGSTRAWGGQLSAFVESGFQVVIYDRWGYGKSNRRNHLNVPCFKEDLSDLEEVISTLKIKPVSLIGHSDGGTIALYYAIQNPGDVSTLVTIAAHIYIESKMLPGIHGLKEAFEVDPRFRNGLEKAHGAKFDSTFNNWFNGWLQSDTKEWDMRPMLSSVQCPALVIQGICDEHATPQHARDIFENIPNSDLWLAPEGKHMLPQENPEEFNLRVTAFLKSNLDIH